MSKESKIILGIISLVVAVAVALVVYVDGSSDNSATINERLVQDSSHRLGDGKVEIVEFGDYQCPACAQAHPISKQIIEEFEGDVTFIYRHFPLPQIHGNALAAAEAAEAAGAQGKFWEMHDKLFEAQDRWGFQPDPTDTFVGYATDLELDVDKFKQDITDRANQQVISDDQSDGYAVGVSGTPVFFVDGKRQSNFDYETLKRAVEAALDNQE